MTESLNRPWPILHYSCSSSHVVFSLSSGAISSPFYFLSIYFQSVSVRTQIECRILKVNVCLFSSSWNRFCPIFYQHAAAATISLWSRWHVCSFVMLFWKIQLLFVLQPGVSTDDAGAVRCFSSCGHQIWKKYFSGLCRWGFSGLGSVGVLLHDSGFHSQCVENHLWGCCRQFLLMSFNHNVEQAVPCLIQSAGLAEVFRYHPSVFVHCIAGLKKLFSSFWDIA